MSLLCGGGGGGGGAEVDPEAAKLDAMANKAAKNEAEADSKIIKMLLLGAGESGKSTIFKQMKIINKNGYSDKEKQGFVGIVHSNTVQSMATLMEAFDHEKVKHEMPADLKAMYDKFEGMEERTTEKLNTTFSGLIKDMWNHPATKEVFDKKSDYQLNDSADYYFNDIDRISADGYLPTEQDVLRSRVRTTGIVQSDFVIKGLNFAMFDVGGQRNERRKWIHAFDSVNCVVFVAAFSEYDQMLFEDENTNRMEEALQLFDQIVNSKWFKDTSMILFGNKKDLFEMKLAKKSLKDFYPEFTGENNLKDGGQFFIDKFKSKAKDPEKSIFHHITCATDTGNVKFVFNAVVAIILEENMKKSGLA